MHSEHRSGCDGNEDGLGRQLGYLLPGQEAALTAAIRAAFDLE